jgi:hypothetical protein
MSTGRHAMFLALLALAMSWLYGHIDYLGEFRDVDLRHYRAMAQAAPAIDADVPRPFAHRLLGPYLAGLLPFPDPLAFRLLSTALLVGATLTLFGFLRCLGLADPLAAFAAALSTLNPYWFGFIAFNPFQAADAMALVCVAGAFWAYRSDRLAAYAALLVLGALAREPVILVVPAVAFAVASRAEWRWRPAVPWLAAGLPAVAAFILVRILVPAPGPGFAEALLAHAGKALDPATWYRLLVNSYAPLSLLPIVFWRTSIDFARRQPGLMVFAVLVLVSALFGGDQERLVAPAFVTAYALVGTIIAHHLWDVRWIRWVIALGAFATSLHHLTARFPLPSRRLTLVISVAALLFVTAAAIVARRRRQRGVPTSPA